MPIPSTYQEEAIASEIRALRDFAELSSDWFWEQDSGFRFTRFFGTSTEKLRRKQTDFLGKRRWDMPIFGITSEQLAQHIATVELKEPFRNFEYEVLGDDAQTQYYSISGTPILDEQGVFQGYRGTGKNITELRLAERAILESEQKLAQIVDGSSIATFVIDAQHRVTHWNQACVQLTGLSASQVLGTADAWRAFYPAPRPCLADLVVDAAVDVEIAEHYANCRPFKTVAGALEAEEHFPGIGDGGRWLYFTAAPLRHCDGGISGAIETLQDISLQRKTQAELEKLVSRDGLTGIANRRCFDQQLANVWARACRHATHLSLLMIDVDHFKRYNDTYGHPAGDACLQQVAALIAQALCRPGDSAARYGGEEFAVILADTDTAGATEIARRIIERVTRLALPHNGGEGGRVTLSIGIATVIPTPELCLENLIACADAALYQAKDGGRNCFVAV